MHPFIQMHAPLYPGAHVNMCAYCWLWAPTCCSLRWEQATCTLLERCHAPQHEVTVCMVSTPWPPQYRGAGRARLSPREGGHPDSINRPWPDSLTPCLLPAGCSVHKETALDRGLKTWACFHATGRRLAGTQLCSFKGQSREGQRQALGGHLLWQPTWRQL